jgi:predicted HTH transcriptional regulator
MNPYLKDLIGRGEHQKLDFKYEISDSRKISWTFSAFSNTDGGRLLVGVKDNGKVVGVQTEEEVHMIMGAGELFCKPALKPELIKWDVMGKTVLEVYIPKATRRPVYARDESDQWKVWVRVHDQNFKANRVLIRSWSHQKRKKGAYIEMTEKENQFLKYLDLHQKITFSKTRKLLRWSHRKVENMLVNFLVLDVIQIHFDHDGIHYSLKKNHAE